LVFCAIAVAGAVEMVLELEQPFAGVLHISPLPMHKMVYGLNELIPNPTDQNRCAQSRNPIDMIVQGWSTSLFQAKQQCSRMSS